MNNTIKYSISGTILIFALIFFLSSFTQIDSGNVGIESTLGNVKPEVLGRGVYQTVTRKIEEYTLKDVPYSFDNLTPKTKNNISMKDVDVDIYVRTLPAKLPALYVKYRGDRYEDSDGNYAAANGRISKEARESIYSAVAEFDASTIHTKRNEFSLKIQNSLQAALDKSDPGAFQVSSINIRALVTDPQLEEAIRAQANVDQQIQAKEKQIELAKKEAGRLKAEAEGAAAANLIIAASITEPLIKLKHAEAALAAANKTSSVVQINGNATPLIQVK